MEHNDLKDIFDSVEVLSRAKLQAGNRVKLIKTMREEEEISVSDHRRMVALYGEARADVNSGIDRLLIEVEAAGKIENEGPFEEIASRAAEQVETFITESDQLVFGEDRSGVVEAGISFAGAIVSAMVDVWKSVRGERTTRHAKFVERLDSLKWPAFEEF